MDIVFNEAAYSKKVSSLQEAADIYSKFLKTYFTLKTDKRITKEISFYGKVVDISSPITLCGDKIYDLQKVWGSKGKTAYSQLLWIFNRFASLKNIPLPHKRFVLDDISFLIPENDDDTILMSLLTLPKYGELYLEGNIEDSGTLTVKNMSEHTHIEKHRIALGIRCYEKNPKHKSTYTNMGNGEYASPMDLSDEEAQEALNAAVSIDAEKVLYSIKKGKCYAFREHEPGKAIYHGYLVENPPEKVRRALEMK